MVITITAPAGGNKTKTALEMAATMGLRNQQKVVYLTKDMDYGGWVAYVEGFCGRENLNHFRPVYCTDLEGALHILPYVDRMPYDYIILDGFEDEISALGNTEYAEMITKMAECTTDKNGKIILITKK